MAQGFTKGVPVDTDVTMAAGSNLLVPSQYAVVQYVASQIALSGGVTAVTASAPMASSGGPTPNITISNAVADGITKGAATFDSNDFNSSSGLITIDYTNGQAASSLNKGFLTSSDWTTFNNKLSSNQIITLSSDVTGSGTTSITATIASGAVTLGKMSNLAANSIIGNNTGSSATPIALTTAQTTAMLDVFTSSLKGLTPASGGGTTNFLRADGTWAAPAAGSGITSLNALTGTTQTFAVGTSGTNFNVSSVGTVHTFNIPDASAANRGLVTTGAQTFAGAKTFSSAPIFSTMTAGSVLFAGTSGTLTQDNAELFFNDTNNTLGLGTAAPSSKMHVIAGTLAQTTKNYGIHLTATFPTSYTYLPRGMYIELTTAGTQTNTSYPQRGFDVLMNAGYTGPVSTVAVSGANAAAGTAGVIVQGGVPSGNCGFLYTAVANTTGYNYGCAGFARLGNVSIGVVGRVGLDTTTNNKNGAKYIGVVGIARNDTAVNSVSCGGYFGLNTTDPTFANAALICDNADATYDIFVARDNGVARWTIQDGGNTAWADGINMRFDTVTGTKIATSTSQKIAFWNATPIVQPTTAVTSAARVTGGGINVTDTDTFDGYTIAQVVKALRDTGLLA